MIYDIKKVKQLKLVTGEEVLCEIVEEDENDIIIRNALGIQFHYLEDGSRIWTFKYFMCYQSDPERFILLKIDKIVSIANPIPELVKQYISATDEMLGDEPASVDPYDEFERELEFMNDSDQSNVVKFPTVH